MDTKLTPEDEERLRQEEMNRLRNAEAYRRQESANARAETSEAAKSPGPEAGGMHPGARDARYPRPAGMTPETFPNLPGGGFRRNPANQQTELPPERQAPPAPEGKIGQGRVKPHEQS